MASDLADVATDLPITASERVFTGRIWNVARESVDLGEAGEVTREFVQHTGAVAILALDEADRVVLVNQYRHPVRRMLWELPAGLLDVPGEALVEAARRELAEEADLVAADWHTLGDFYTTPGGSDEFIRIFLARGLSAVPEAERHEREDEELGMQVRRAPLDEVVAGVLAGRIHNPSTGFGVLAAAAARDLDWSTLRAADAPF
ncbi:NUDIX hydrolase [Pseudactinotalea sp. HY158]|uniref:NUDIX domain-containing protein n=1 Tax=Pseudactinotalea sp. HY158 TaxID=2654547 RepID=UPI00129C5AD1|nr:NUDIX hydrolase [Pseudactinotalea sp. HY158]QGH69091.1 NUDIX domain-containing protein [Pseudactinotalea sp. HY158]